MVTGDKKFGVVLCVIPVVRGWDLLSQKTSYHKNFSSYNKIMIKILIQNMENF